MIHICGRQLHIGLVKQLEHATQRLPFPIARLFRKRCIEKEGREGGRGGGGAEG